jgi:hypothetical protein
MGAEDLIRKLMGDRYAMQEAENPAPEMSNIQQEEPINEISVVGNRPQAQQERASVSGVPAADYGGINLDNSEMRSLVSRNAEQTERDSRNGNEELGIEPRKGMFGIKGTLRDILGLVGDSFLIGGGGSAIYAPQREKERRADALAGESVDPDGAFERLNHYDPEGAQALKDQYGRRTNAENSNLISAQNATRQQTDSDIDNRDKAMERIMRWVDATKSNPDARANLFSDVIPKFLEGRGLTLDDLPFDQFMTDEDAAVISSGDVSVNQARSLERRDRQLTVSERNSDIGQQNANTAAGRAKDYRGRSVSVIEEINRISRLPPSERRVEEQKWIDKQTNPTGKAPSAIDRLISGSTDKPPKTRFRPVSGGN